MYNKIYVGISTAKPNEEISKLRQHIENTCGCEVKINIISNTEGVGLTSIYQNILDSEDAKEYGIVVLMHDDIEFLQEGWGAELLRLFNNNTEYGIIGVAGSAEFDSNAAWWMCEKIYGQVVHRRNGQTWLSTFSPLIEDGLEEVCVIDGLFMAVCLDRATNQFDKNIKGFDFYDIDFCLNTFINKTCKIGVTTNIRVLHDSVGILKPSWFTNRDKIREKYKNYLPIKVI